jgi:hypothetical protein
MIGPVAAISKLNEPNTYMSVGLAPNMSLVWLSCAPRQCKGRILTGFWTFARRSEFPFFVSFYYGKASLKSLLMGARGLWPTRERAVLKAALA